jgi:hypothetical protein
VGLVGPQVFDGKLVTASRKKDDDSDKNNSKSQEPIPPIGKRANALGQEKAGVELERRGLENQVSPTIPPSGAWLNYLIVTLGDDSP